jgi:hypothetical protein
MKQLFLSLLLAVSTGSVLAQPSGPSPGINATMLKMFGDIKTFTAQAEARLVDQNQKEISAMPMTMSMRDNKLRAEMDMSQVKGGSIPPEAAGMLKQAGMDRMVTLVVPDQKATLIIYPGLKSYAEAPISETEAASPTKVETADLGEEKIDGHNCKKVKLTNIDAQGNKHEATVWQATGLKNFPLQMQMPQKGNTLIVKYQAPKMEADAASFEIPKDYTKYPSVQALMQAAMMKMFGGLESK